MYYPAALTAVILQFEQAGKGKKKRQPKSSNNAEDTMMEDVQAPSDVDADGELTSVLSTQSQSTCSSHINRRRW